MQCTCYWFMQLKQIVLHRSCYLNCYLILWLMLLFVLNVTQRARALSRRAEETEAAGNEENQYLYWYFHTLLCTLCNYKVSVNLHPGKGCWDALLAQGSRALWARTGLVSCENLMRCFHSCNRRCIYWAEKWCKMSQCFSTRSWCSLRVRLCSLSPVNVLLARQSIRFCRPFFSCHLLLRLTPQCRGWSPGKHQPG